MTDISIPYSDDEIEQLPEGLELMKKFIDDAQHVIDHPDAYNKAEVLGKLEFFVDFLRQSFEIAAPIMEGTYEIHQLTKNPDS